MKLKKALYLYRIINWKKKVSGMRQLGYLFFGYLMAGNIKPIPLVFNTIAICGALMITHLLNDYYDWKLHGEENFLARFLGVGKNNMQLIFGVFSFPVFLILFIFPANVNSTTLLFYASGLALSILYSMPPIRLKERYIWGVFVPPFCVMAMFLQGYTLFHSLSYFIILLTILIIIFQLYLEILHILDDTSTDIQTNEEKEKLCKDTASKVLKILPILSLILSIIFALFYPIFIFTSLFSIVRMVSLKSFKIDDAHAVRKNLFSLQLSLYEFICYVLYRFLIVI